MPNKERVHTVVTEVPTKTQTSAEANEAPRTTARSIIDWVKCSVLKQCDIAEIRKDTATRLTDLSQVRNSRVSSGKVQDGSSTPSKMKVRGRVETLNLGTTDLSGLQELQSEIGAKSMTRKLLFGNNSDIRREYGSFSSENDRRLWAKLMQMPETAREKHPLYKKLLKKKGETIQIPSEYPIDFKRNLSELWEEKLGMSNKNTPLIEFYKNQIAPIISNSRNWKKMSIEGYENEIGTDIGSIVMAGGGTEAVSKKISGAYNLSDRETVLFRKLVGTIGAEELITLSMTETMDNVGGEINRELLSIILEHGGREYLMSIPALGDAYVSYGPYQLTKWTVGGMIRPGSEPSADKIDRILTGGKILTGKNGGKFTIENFPTNLHHKAAYLSLLDNIASTLKKMPEKYKGKIIIPAKTKHEKPTKIEGISNPMKHLEKAFQKSPSDATTIIIQYVAAAHNNPTAAYDGLISWLYEYERSEITEAGNELRKYIDMKTAKNNANRQHENGKGYAEATQGKFAKYNTALSDKLASLTSP